MRKDWLAFLEADFESSFREKATPPEWVVLLFGAPSGIRTPDTLLKRQVLYLLS